MRHLYLFVLLVLSVGFNGCKFGGIGVSQDPTDFGYVWIGQSGLKGIVWTNNTNGPVTLQTYQTPQPPFDYKALTATNIPLAPGSGYGAEVIASPTQAGLFTEELVAHDLEGVNVQPTLLKVIGLGRLEKGSLTLSGGYINALPAPPAGPGSTGPTGSPNNGPMDFGSIPINSHLEKTITLNNSGTSAAQVNINLLTRGSQAFTVSMTTGGAPLTSLSIPAKGSTTIIVSFKPPYVGKYYAVLQIFDGVQFETSANAAGLALTGAGRQAMD
jgi:hypothetical protein